MDEDGGDSATIGGVDVSRPEIYRDDRWQEPFRLLRARSPVHLTRDSRFGPYWSVSTYDGIVEVESAPEVYSSARGMTIIDPEQAGDGSGRPAMFISMDPPRHGPQRHSVAPAFAPSEMARLAEGIRTRTGELLDALPLGRPFDWVRAVSVELTTQMLAVLFDFPWEDRGKLTTWSDWMSGMENLLDEERRDVRRENVLEAGAYFHRLWQERLHQPPSPDLISLMAHSKAMRDVEEANFLGNLVLLIVGGNDTTRNSMSAAAYGLDRFPDQRTRLEGDPGLVPNAVSELIRWQTPLAHMRRTAVRDVELRGQLIREGDKVVLWYLSANRDSAVFGGDADDIVVDRRNARRHLAFGHGLHRCVGARLAELQVGILLEEMLARRLRVNVAAEPVRVADCFIHGFDELRVELGRY